MKNNGVGSSKLVIVVIMVVAAVDNVTTGLVRVRVTISVSVKVWVRD